MGLSGSQKAQTVDLSNEQAQDPLQPESRRIDDHNIGGDFGKGNHRD